MRRSQRPNGGWVGTSELPVPPGAPAGVRRALRRARVARALGPGLGPHLLAVRGGRRLELVFRGSGWEAPLRHCGDRLRERLEPALGHPVDEIVVTAGGGEDVAALPVGSAKRSEESERLAPGPELSERLRRLGEAWRERRRRESAPAPDVR